MEKEDMNKQNENQEAVISRKAQLVKVINNSPLVEAEPSINSLHENLDISTSGGSIYYGTGLTTPRAIGVGLPFDVLGMMLTAEQLRRAGNFDNIYHHIADTHAKTNDWIDPADVDRRASEVKGLVDRISQNLDLPNLHVVLSSEFDSKLEYLELLAGFQSSPEHEYVKREMADMEWYRLHYGTELKLGWIIQAKETGLGFDERLFDREYVKMKGPILSFVYGKAGRTFDKGRPKASPYIQVEGERRLVIDSSTDAKSTIDEAIEASGDPTLGGAIKHLDNIVRLYEKLYGHLGRIQLDEKLQIIIKRIAA